MRKVIRMGTAAKAAHRGGGDDHAKPVFTGRFRPCASRGKPLRYLILLRVVDEYLDSSWSKEAFDFRVPLENERKGRDDDERRFGDPF